MSIEREARSARDTVAGIWTDMSGPVGDLSALCLGGRDPVLPSVFPVTTVATASIAAATLGAAGLLADRNRESLRGVHVSTPQAAIAFRSERHVHALDGALGDLWDPVAGDYPTADGWIRLHTNYAHHRTAALRVLGVPPDRAAVTAAVARHSAVELETAVIAAGGVAAALRSRDTWRAHPHGARVGACPLVTIERGTSCPPVALPVVERPLAGAGGLNLTRGIAGPGGTRSTRAAGAERRDLGPGG